MATQLKASLLCPVVFVLLLGGLVASAFAANSIFVAGTNNSTFEDFEIGDSVEVRQYGNPGDAWNPKDTYPGKVIKVKADEPRYQVRVTASVSGGRDGWFYSWNVRRAERESIDEYSTEYLIGSWNVGPGTSENTVASRDNGDGTRTNTIERSLIANNNLLRINADGTYSWRASSRETIRGRWETADDPDFPITLFDAYWGEDWQAGPDGMHRGKQYIKLRSATSKKRFWGPRLSGAGATGTSRQTNVERESAPPRRAPNNASRQRSSDGMSGVNAAPNQANASQAGVPSFNVGARIQAQSRDGKWYNGIIAEIDGERFQIRYDNNNPYTLEWVTADKVRSPR